MNKEKQCITKVEFVTILESQLQTILNNYGFKSKQFIYAYERGIALCEKYNLSLYILDQDIIYITID